MILDPVSDRQVQAARVFAGATMAGFLGASLFRGRARNIRLAVAAVYLAGVVLFTIYLLL